MALPDCNFLRELGSARVRADGLDEVSAQVLMCLATDPLLVHRLVNENQSLQPERQERVRLPLLDVVQLADTRSRLKAGYGYGSLEPLHPDSLRPDVFLPSTEDYKKSVSVASVSAGIATVRGFRLATLTVTVFAFLTILVFLR